MNALERLRRDHQLLRAKLDVLEAALRMGPETWFVLRELSCSLGRQLRDHIQREEQLIAQCRTALSPQLLEAITMEHHEEPLQLRMIQRMFLSRRHTTLDRVRPILEQVIRSLRHHIAEEERVVFPIIERTLGLRDTSVADASGQFAGAVAETMTVNRIVREFPSTKFVFERLFINIPLEGSSCLDEVAWRHGIDSTELLQQLEAALADTFQLTTPCMQPARKVSCSLR